jgi:hypothetical protein
VSLWILFWVLLVAMSGLIGLYYYLSRWYDDRQFYRAKNFDYSLDNPKAGKILYDYDSPDTPENRVPNHIRVKIVNPFVVIFYLFFFFCSLLGTSYVIYRIASCNSVELEKCGIKIGAEGIEIKQNSQ